MTHVAERREVKEATQSRGKGREERAKFDGGKTRHGEKGEPRGIAKKGTTMKHNTHNPSAQGDGVVAGQERVRQGLRKLMIDAWVCVLLQTPSNRKLIIVPV